jgi:L-ascorbate oxidase
MILLLLYAIVSSNLNNHPCNRKCDSHSKTKMICIYNWTIEWTNVLLESSCKEFSGCIAANGVKRSLVTINKSLPGPPIEVCQGGFIRVNLMNNLDESESISIDWHGQTHHGTPFMDGAAMVTQCKIKPKTKFSYE